MDVRRITDKTDERTGESSNVFLKQRFESGSQWEIWDFFSWNRFFVGEREGKGRAMGGGGGSSARLLPWSIRSWQIQRAEQSIQSAFLWGARLPVPMVSAQSVGSMKTRTEEFLDFSPFLSSWISLLLLTTPLPRWWNQISRSRNKTLALLLGVRLCMSSRHTTALHLINSPPLCLSLVHTHTPRSGVLTFFPPLSLTGAIQRGDAVGWQQCHCHGNGRWAADATCMECKTGQDTRSDRIWEDGQSVVCLLSVSLFSLSLPLSRSLSVSIKLNEGQRAVTSLKCRFFSVVARILYHFLTVL